MIKDIRFVILKVREIYYRRMWVHSVSKEKKCECEKQYQMMYVWRDTANNYLEKQRFVTGRIREMGL